MLLDRGAIKAELQDYGSVTVSGVWIYNIAGMTCSHYSGDETCCEDSFKTLDEAVDAVIDMADGDMSAIKVTG